MANEQTGDAPVDVTSAYAAVAAAMTPDSTVDDVLRAVATQLCGLVGGSRCSVYLRDPDTGVFRGRVGHARVDIDAQVRRLVAGVEADGFTREILRNGIPVAIDDTRLDPRPVRSTMRAWDVRSMLGVPLGHRDDAFALAFVDREGERRRFDREAREVAGRFARLAAITVRQAIAVTAHRDQLDAALRQNRLLRRAGALDEALLEAAARGTRALVDELTERTGRPTLVVDADRRPIARAGDVAFDPGTDLGGDGRARIVVHGATRRDRVLVADVLAPDGVELGRLLLGEQGGPGFNGLDRHAAVRAAALLALGLTAERRIVGARNDSRAALCSDLLRGDRDLGWLEARGRALGVDLSMAHVVCVVAADDVRALSAALDAAGDPVVAVTALDDAVACLLAVPAIAAHDPAAGRQLARGALAEVPGVPLAAVSEPVHSAGGIATAHCEAAAALDCARGLVATGARRVITTRDLGAARLLLTATGTSGAADFAERTLGPLLEPGTAPELLETVDAFLAGSHGVRAAATSLGVHENTIRYRLGRIHEVTGLDIATSADDQLTALLALRVLQLQGRCAWPADDDEAERPALALVS